MPECREDVLAQQVAAQVLGLRTQVRRSFTHAIAYSRKVRRVQGLPIFTGREPPV
jgi:hypothetical protein